MPDGIDAVFLNELRYDDELATCELCGVEANSWEIESAIRNQMPVECWDFVACAHRRAFNVW